MSIFAKIFGSDGKSPSAFTTISEVSAAISTCEAERSIIAGERLRLNDRRHMALESDKPDAEIKKIDGELDRIDIAEERLEILMPRLYCRMSELQTEDRSRTLDSLRDEYRKIEKSLDAALAAVLSPLESWHEIIRQIDASGFEAEARSFVTRAPLVGSGAIASKETLELWRQERERLTDMITTSAKGLPFHKQSLEPVSVMPTKTVTTSLAPPRPRRPPQKIEASPAFGFCKVVILRNGVEVDGVARIGGDELILANHQAEKIVRNAAGEIIETGRIENEAAE